MITYKEDMRADFLVDAKEYPSCPSNFEIKRIRWIESEVISQSPDFLQDPEFYVSEWEELTGDEMPERYTSELPSEMKSFIYGKKNQGRIGIETALLPLQDTKGQQIVYPETRLLSDSNRYHGLVYVLQDNLYKEFQPA